MDMAKPRRKPETPGSEAGGLSGLVGGIGLTEDRQDLRQQ
jgi:hypothetical protein